MRGIGAASAGRPCRKRLAVQPWAATACMIPGRAGEPGDEKTTTAWKDRLFGQLGGPPGVCPVCVGQGGEERGARFLREHGALGKAGQGKGQGEPARQERTRSRGAGFDKPVEVRAGKLPRDQGVAGSVEDHEQPGVRRRGLLADPDKELVHVGEHLPVQPARIIPRRVLARLQELLAPAPAAEARRGVTPFCHDPAKRLPGGHGREDREGLPQGHGERVGGESEHVRRLQDGLPGPVDPAEIGSEQDVPLGPPGASRACTACSFRSCHRRGSRNRTVSPGANQRGSSTRRCARGLLAGGRDHCRKAHGKEALRAVPAAAQRRAKEVACKEEVHGTSRKPAPQKRPARSARITPSANAARASAASRRPRRVRGMAFRSQRISSGCARAPPGSAPAPAPRVRPARPSGAGGARSPGAPAPRGPGRSRTACPAAGRAPGLPARA